jgi:hypothetical protein
MGNAFLVRGVPYFFWGNRRALRQAADGTRSHDEDNGDGFSQSKRSGCFRARLGHEAVISARKSSRRSQTGLSLPSHQQGACSYHKRGTRAIGANGIVQNIPFGLARGIFGAIKGAEFFGSPTSCKVSQCSIAFPSASIL